jgi:hypothetical protein
MYIKNYYLIIENFQHDKCLINYFLTLLHIKSTIEFDCLFIISFFIHTSYHKNLCKYLVLNPILIFRWILLLMFSEGASTRRVINWRCIRWSSHCGCVCIIEWGKSSLFLMIIHLITRVGVVRRKNHTNFVLKLHFQQHCLDHPHPPLLIIISPSPKVSQIG